MKYAEQPTTLCSMLILDRIQTDKCPYYWCVCARESFVRSFDCCWRE